MKRILISIVVLLIIAISFLYLFIPTNYQTFAVETLPFKSDALLRIVQKDNAWMDSITNNTKKSTDTVFTYNNKSIKIKYKTISSTILSIADNRHLYNSTINFVPHEPDSCAVVWELNSTLSNNPFKRISEYVDLKNTKKDISSLLNKFSSCFSTVKNVYGLDIKKEEVNDSILVSTFINTTGFPSTSTIYSQINKLKDFIKTGSANITGSPMLNITTQDSITYLVRVALPVDKQLPSTKDFAYKRMMGKGKILRAEITGPYTAINQGFKQMNEFVLDNHYVNPAISFQSLLTDRLQVKDSTKWITNIYVPVM